MKNNELGSFNLMEIYNKSLKGRGWIYLSACVSFFFVVYMPVTDASEHQESSQGHLKSEVNGVPGYRYYFSRQTSSLDGFLQTPDGGEPGRTDRHRPSFDELGIDEAQINTFGFEVGSGKNFYEASFSPMRFDETLVLGSSLLSQWIQFETGEQVRAKIKMDTFRFSYLRELREEIYPDWRIRLGGEILGMDFHYRLFNQDKRVDRSYMKAGYRLGAKFLYTFNKKTGLELEMFQSLPFPNTVDATTVNLFAYYNLLGSSESVDNVLQIRFGLSYQKLRYKDEQESPNFLIAETGPGLSIGLVYQP